MVLSENNTRVLLKLAGEVAVIVETPTEIRVTAKSSNPWERVMLVGLLSPFDGVFDCSRTVTIPRSHLPNGFNLNPLPDEAVALSYAESRAAAPAEPVKLSQKEVCLKQLKENFRRRMSQEEVAIAVRFLLSQGMSADQVVAETGASLSTVYRSLRLSAETSPAPEAVS